jgi:5-methylthioadenosine/S-adenosylhomocysteine deaminase
LKDAKEISDRYGALFNTHAAETRAEQADILNRYGNSVIRHLEAHNLLGPNSILAHCVHVDTTEIKMIADSGTIVTHNPMSNLKLGSGIAPVSNMLDAGIHITLGTDGAISGNDLDMWLTMRLTASLPKGAMMRADVVTAKQVLHMATLNGADALGQSKNLGSLEPGKAADFIMLDLNAVHAVPIFDPITHLVYSTSKSDVRDVFVDGKQLVRDGNLTKLDMDQTLDEVRALTPSIQASLE